MALLTALLGATLALAAPAAKASSATVKLVEFFVKTPTGDLPPEQVPDFLAVDSATLPQKLQTPYESKKFELLALKKNSDAKYKPPLRLLGKESAASDENCGPPRDMATHKLLLQVGFAEVTEDEVQYLMQETKCTECELRTEFTLTIVATPPAKKGGKKQLHYLFHANDPIMTLLATYRSGTKTPNTNFFGISAGPKCR